jgi:hypothetical protein
MNCNIHQNAINAILENFYYVLWIMRRVSPQRKLGLEKKKLCEALKSHRVVLGRDPAAERWSTQSKLKRSAIGELVRRIIINSTVAMFIITSAKLL